MTTQQIKAIIEECHNQAGDCQYTSASLYKWLGAARQTNQIWNAVPIVLGAFASYAILADKYPIIASIFALVAGMMPSIYEKLEIKTHTDEILSQAGQYKILEHGFRQAALITSHDTEPNALKVEFDSLMRRMDELRARPLVIPDEHFKKAQDEIQKEKRYVPDAPGMGSNQKR